MLQKENAKVLFVYSTQQEYDLIWRYLNDFSLYIPCKLVSVRSEDQIRRDIKEKKHSNEFDEILVSHDISDAMLMNQLIRYFKKREN